MMLSARLGPDVISPPPGYNRRVNTILGCDTCGSVCWSVRHIKWSDLFQMQTTMFQLRGRVCLLILAQRICLLVY